MSINNRRILVKRSIIGQTFIKIKRIIKIERTAFL